LPSRHISFNRSSVSSSHAAPRIADFPVSVTL
jgi:hypothetical protein